MGYAALTLRRQSTSSAWQAKLKGHGSRCLLRDVWGKPTNQPTNFAHAMYPSMSRLLSTDSTPARSDNPREFRLRSFSFSEELAQLPDGTHIHLDFFGEPITFAGGANQTSVSSAVAALDGFEIGMISKGQSFSGGGEEYGLSIKAAHSSAMSWAELLRHASIWATEGKSAPMLAYVAISPLLAQAGVGYVGYIDNLLEQVNSGVDGIPPIQLLPLAREAASMKDDKYLNERERTHLSALDAMLVNDHKRALRILMRHLQSCPGDALALSLAMDLSQIIGDKAAAMRTAASVASYWNERRSSFLRPGIPGHHTASALVAVGLAVGGRENEAEQLINYAMKSGKKVSGGIATLALANLYDSQGRTAEGISACANSDGMINFESCGLLFFDSVLSGYGVRFCLDREERGRGRSKALGLYDNNYERILDYSGFAQGRVWATPEKKAPLGWRKSQFSSDDGGSPRSFMKTLFNINDPEKNNKKRRQDEIVAQKASLPMKHESSWTPSCEDVLTWLPPTPKILTDATILLLRLTLNGTISSKNYRWDEMRNSWSAMLDMNTQSEEKYADLNFYPLAFLTASLLAPPDRLGKHSGSLSKVAEGLHRLGDALDLGDIEFRAQQESSEEDESGEMSLTTKLMREIVAEKQPDFWLPVTDVSEINEWRTIVRLLSCGIDGVYWPLEDTDDETAAVEISPPVEGWDLDIRPVLEHTIVFAACKSGDKQSLSLARSICSEGVTLRPNSPEQWWRYSIVLGLLGDEVASEDALQASIAFGGGQGVRGDMSSG